MELAPVAASATNPKLRTACFLGIRFSPKGMSAHKVEVYGIRKECGAVLKARLGTRRFRTSTKTHLSPSYPLGQLLSHSGVLPMGSLSEHTSSRLPGPALR